MNKNIEHTYLTSKYTYDALGSMSNNYQYLYLSMMLGGNKSFSWASHGVFLKHTVTEQLHFGARYYASDISVWLSVDPLSDMYASTSPYAYVENNPIMFVDPNGLFKTWVGAAIYKVFHGGEINKDKESGHYFVGKDIEVKTKNPSGYDGKNDEGKYKGTEGVNVAYKRVFGWDGNDSRKKKKVTAGFRITGNMDGLDGTIGGGYEAEYDYLDMSYSIGNPMVNLTLYIIKKYSLSITPKKTNSQKQKNNTSSSVPNELKPQSAKGAKLDPKEKIWVMRSESWRRGRVGCNSLITREDSADYVDHKGKYE